jgi:DeoR family transcriptional regulator, fructose operon transcriptional repressor
LFQQKRKEKILELLEEKKELELDKLCKYFNVSLATIHRDLNSLEREGSVKKVHGGVLLNIIEDIETRNTIRLKKNIDLKRRIAKKAIELVKEGDCIFLDNSTTCYYFAEELSKSNFKDIAIITNSCSIPRLFLKNGQFQLVSTGGLYLKEMDCLTGPCAIATINEFNGDKFFLSVAAISIKGELSDVYRPESDEVKKEMFKRSKDHICLVDSTKFNHIGQSKVFPLTDIDKIITDNKCRLEIRKDFESIGKKLIIS